MLWPGTVIGAGAGFAIANIPGAMLGALLGQAADRRLQLHSWAELFDRLRGKPQLRDDQVLFVLLGRLAKCDGRVVESHIQQAREEMRSLRLNEAQCRSAIVAFNRGKDGRDRLQHHLQRLGQQPNSAEGVLRACWRMAWADGSVSREERQLVVQWGKWLGWTSVRVQGLSSDYEPSRKPLANSGGAYQEAMRLLGVTATTEAAQVKRAYRRLLSRHHPDKLAGTGATPLQVREATERTRELHSAYALIRERRGLR
ncbi:TerB family tellurite resistance protein [Pseudomonas sp. TE3610]